MALAGIELRYIINRISEVTSGYFVSNIYGIAKDSILFKLRHVEKNDLHLMVSTMGVWLTSVRLDQMEGNALQRRLRGDLLRMKLKEIKQVGSERIAHMIFEGFDREIVLVVEFFGDGNILLCDEHKKILALQHSVNVRHRKLVVGAEYVLPPPNNLDIFSITESDFDGIKDAGEMAIARWLGKTLGLPKRYAEGILHMAGIEPTTPSRMINLQQQRSKMCDAAKKLVEDITTGNHQPIVTIGDTPEALPVVPAGMSKDSFVHVDSFVDGLDTVFTKSLVGRARYAKSVISEGEIKTLQTQVTEQTKAIDTVKTRSKSITALANSLMGAVTTLGIITIIDPGLAQTLTTCGAELVKIKGVLHVAIADEKIRIPNPQVPIQSIASILFDEAKHQARAVPSIEKAKARVEQKLEKLHGKIESERDSKVSSTIRKKGWYERYRWFITSDGMLAVGGRDAASNSAVIRKQMGQGDRVFHAEVQGSPFFILKNAQSSASDLDMTEVSHATVCFSRAWREGMHGTNSYWVQPDQVKKSAPTGQFLPKGSFTISGQRNFIRSQTLRLSVGMVPRGGGYTITCGPIDAIQKISVYWAVIEPHGLDMAEAAKKIKIEFMQVEPVITKGIPLDDFVRALPAGKSQIKDVGYGDTPIDTSLVNP